MSNKKICDYNGIFCESVYEYGNLCGYTYINELSGLDFIAMKAKYLMQIDDIKLLKQDVALFIRDQLNKDDDNKIISANKETITNKKNVSDEPEVNVDDIIIKGTEIEDTNNINYIIPTKKIIGEVDSNLPNQITLNNELNIVHIEANINNNDIEINSIDMTSDVVRDSDVSMLMMSVRATNALIANGINTVEKLLECSAEALLKFKNIGRKTFDEILKIRNTLLDIEIDEADEEVTSISFRINDKILKNVENLLYGTDIVGEALSKEEGELYERVKKSIEIVGEETLLQAFNSPQSGAEINECLKQFCRCYQNRKAVLELFDSIPQARYDNLLIPYFDNNSLRNIYKFLSSDYKIMNYSTIENYRIIDLKNAIEVNNLDKSECESIKKVIEYLSINIEKEFKNALDFVLGKSERSFRILCLRAGGETLQNVADDSGLTRERIRQIEVKAVKYIVKKFGLDGIQPLSFISADLNNDSLLTFSELQDYFADKELASIFLYIISAHEEMREHFTYLRDLNAFRREDVESTQNVDISVLPNIVFGQDFDGLLRNLVVDSNINIEELRMRVMSHYKKAGNVYHRGKLTKEIMYSYILKLYYPGGIKLYDRDALEHFSSKVLNVFGEIKLPSDYHAFDARISAVSILCDRGTYIHPDYVKIDDDIICKIDKYISDSDKELFSFNDIFEVFKDELLLNSNVNNRYFLSGIIKKKLVGKYYYSRDYISKTGAFSMSSQIEEFIKQHGRIHKGEIFKEFPGLTEIVLSMSATQNRNIITLDGGEFFHASQLNIVDEDYKIKGYIDRYINEHPISSRKLMEDFWNICPDFLIRNNIVNHTELFGVLRYMFENEYKFSRPYIAHVDNSSSLSNIEVIKQYLEEYDSITIEELQEILDKTHILFLSIRNLIRGLNSEFLRISKYTLMRIDMDTFDNETLQCILDNIISLMGDKGYVAGQSITDYLFFPDIGIEWSAFLIRSLVEKYFENEVSIIDIQSTDTYAMNSIFVASSELDVDTYEELLRSILKTEHYREPFISIEDAEQWLRSEGMFLSDVPKCFTDGEIINKDEYGEIEIG